jgi:hypothetical protein
MKLSTIVRTVIFGTFFGITGSLVFGKIALAGDRLPYDAGITPPGGISFAHGGYKAIDFGMSNRTDINARASNSGVVVTSTYENTSGGTCGYGNFVRIRYNNGHYGIYAHLSSRAVSVNQTVNQGDILGKIGTTGCSTGIHLHYERRNATNSQANTYLPNFDENSSSQPWKSQNTGVVQTPPPAPAPAPPPPVLPVPGSRDYASRGLKNYDYFKKVYRYFNPTLFDHFHTTDFSELGNGGAGYGREDSNPQTMEWYVQGRSPFVNNLVTVFRYVNPQTGDHHYTTNFNELGNGSGPWKRETDLGQIWSVPPNSCFTPLYRYVFPATNDHHITPNFNELGNGRDGWVRETDLGYVPTYQNCKNTGVFNTTVNRYRNVASGFHFFTTDFSELGNGRDGFVPENGPGNYILSTVNSNFTKPVYRYVNTANNWHLYTTKFYDIGNGSGTWKIEGVDGYIPENSQSIFRYFNPLRGHFYTRDFNELGNGTAGYTREQDLTQ